MTFWSYFFGFLSLCLSVMVLVLKFKIDRLEEASRELLRAHEKLMDANKQLMSGSQRNQTRTYKAS